jgi:hypothetical protein
MFVAASFIRAMMMERVSNSEMSLKFYKTARRNNPEDLHLHFKLRFFDIRVRCNLNLENLEFVTR